MAEHLESARNLIEGRFLDAGEVLSDAVDGIAALVTGLDALTQLLSPETIAATTQQLTAAAAKLAALPAEQTTHLAAIAKLEDLPAFLSSGLEDMRRSLAYMRAFTVSIKITAGGIATVDPEFPAFAQEACLRVESGRAEVDGLEESLFKLKGELQTALQRGDRFAHGCDSMILSVPEQLLESAAIMATHRGKIAVATAQAGTLARDVRKKVTRILGALQIGDSTRQRVEHIQTGIKLLDENDPALAPDAAARSRAVLCALLAAQLESTLTDFNNDVAEIGAGLAGLGRDATALLDLRSLGYGKTSGDSEGFLQNLERRVAAAAGLVAEIEQADALARDTGQQAALTAKGLSDRLGAVQTMKSDVLYMALNTTLKSSRLGEAGRPLSIIASELRVHAGYLDKTASASVAALKTLNETAAGLSCETASAAGEGAGAALNAAIACIKRASQTTERDLPALATQGEAVMQLLTRSTQRLDFQKEIGDVLGQVARELAGRAADAASCGAEIQATLAVRFAKLAAIYTMAREREIQTMVAAQWGVGMPAATAGMEGGEIKVFEDELF